jgi:hypothetical protein
VSHYQPVLTWHNQQTHMTARCITCGWQPEEATIPLVRLHILAHRNHTVDMRVRTATHVSYKFDLDTSDVAR